METEMVQCRGHTRVFPTKTRPLETELKLNNILLTLIVPESFQVKLLANSKSAYLVSELIYLYLLRLLLCNSYGRYFVPSCLAVSPPPHLPRQSLAQRPQGAREGRGYGFQQQQKTLPNLTLAARPAVPSTSKGQLCKWVWARHRFCLFLVLEHVHPVSSSS